MAHNEAVPEADALEQALPVDDSESPEGFESAPDIPPEVPEADALEQARRLADAGSQPLSLPPDVPEADALEQVLPANVDDDDWR